MDTDYDYISDILPMLFAAKTLEDAGRTDILCDVDDALDPDNCYTFSLEALEHVCDFVTGNYSEERELSSYYFSDESIMGNIIGGEFEDSDSITFSGSYRAS